MPTTDPFQWLAEAGLPLPPQQFGSLGLALSRALAPYFEEPVPLRLFAEFAPVYETALKQYAPMTQGAVGYSPLSQAALAAFEQQTLPIIQQQMELQGLGRSPALGVAVGQSLASALPPFIQQDIQNRMAAAQGIVGATGQDILRMQAAAVADLQNRLAATGFIPQAEQLVQQGAMNAAQLAMAEQQRQSEAIAQAGQLVSGLSPMLTTLAQMQQAQQQLALQAIGQGGQEQQQTGQDILANRQMELLRQQALAEAGTLGLFGSSVIPPTAAGITKTVSGK